MPGDFQFDPLNFYRPLSDEGKVGAQERELTNGRLAMLAIASYVGTEWVYHEPVVSATPALFQPIISRPSSALSWTPLLEWPAPHPTDSARERYEE